MTREEAIAVLQLMIPTPYRADGKSTTHALETIALAMAIKALENEPFINKPCVSQKVCREDKVATLEEIKKEIEDIRTYDEYTGESYLACEYKEDVLHIIGTYMAESEE